MITSTAANNANANSTLNGFVRTSPPIGLLSSDIGLSNRDDLFVFCVLVNKVHQTAQEHDRGDHSFINRVLDGLRNLGDGLLFEVRHAELLERYSGKIE